MRKRNIFILLPILIILFVTYLKYKEIPYEDYQNTTLSDMQKIDKKLKGIVSSYAKQNNIDDAYIPTLYDCAGNHVYTKESTLQLKDVMQECKKDYESGGKSVYYNQSWLMQGFNPYDGSYGPLQKIIQKTLKEPKSYQMLKTSYEMKFEDERPHMFVSIDFKGANIQGYMLTRNMSAKVDAKTKEIYDLK